LVLAEVDFLVVVEVEAVLAEGIAATATGFCECLAAVPDAAPDFWVLILLFLVASDFVVLW